MLVVRMGLNPHYVLDEMTEYELKALLDNSEMIYDKYTLELLRMNAFVTAKGAGAKVKLTDLAVFPWEDKSEKEKPLTIDNIRMMREKAQRLKKYIEDE